MRYRLRLARLIVELAALALVGAACSSESSEDSDPGDSASESSFTVVAYQGAEVLGGEEIDFNSVLGQGTPVVLNYWAAQCPPCLAEMPWFQAAHEQHGDSVLLIGIDVGPFTGLGSNEQGAQLLEDLGITYPAVYAVDDEPLRQLEILSMPSTVFYDSDGEVVDNHAGILAQEQLDDRFAELAAGTE